MNQQNSIDPGRLRERLRLEQKDAQPDGYGGYTNNYELVVDLWASIRPVNIQTANFAGNLRATSTHKIIIRWRSDCRAEMRFTKGARVFLIQSVRDPQENQRYLECECEEIL